MRTNTAAGLRSRHKCFAIHCAALVIAFASRAIAQRTDTAAVAPSLVESTVETVLTPIDATPRAVLVIRSRGVRHGVTVTARDARTLTDAPIELHCETPCRLAVLPGVYQITVDASGPRTLTRQIVVEPAGARVLVQTHGPRAAAIAMIGGGIGLAAISAWLFLWSFSSTPNVDAFWPSMVAMPSSALVEIGGIVLTGFGGRSITQRRLAPRERSTVSAIPIVAPIANGMVASVTLRF